MKNLKIVAALCLIAIVTVIGLSSFSGKSESPVKKTFADETHFFHGDQSDIGTLAFWDDAENEECGGTAETICNITFDLGTSGKTANQVIAEFAANYTPGAGSTLTVFSGGAAVVVNYIQREEQ